MDYLFIDEGRVRIKFPNRKKISSKAPVFIILPWNLTETYQWLLYQCTVKVVSRYCHHDASQECGIRGIRYSER